MTRPRVARLSGPGRGQGANAPGRPRRSEPPGAALAPHGRGPMSPSRTMHILRGIAVSPGIAIGPPLVLDPHGPSLPHRAILAGEVAGELARLDQGLRAASVEAGAAEVEARQRLGPQYADILGAHARMIEDPSLRREARARIERDQVSAEHALNDVLEGYAAKLEALADSHLAARAADVRDIRRRILAQLGGDRPASPLKGGDGPSLILAHDLSPSETAGLDTRSIIGFATEAGGRASHTAIVAEALEIPAVVALGRFLDLARPSRVVIIDGDEGILVLDPDEPTLRRYREAAGERAARLARLTHLAGLPAITADGQAIRLWGNIEFADEAEACLRRGAEGVGLYRSDFLYLNADRPPTEDEQYEAYAAVVRSMGGRPVTIRTLDLGADKVAKFREAADPSRNPVLGLRSLRLSLREPELFRPQLRAILRAAALGDVRLMFPMVATLGEVRKARAVLADVAAELAAEGVPARADLPVGVMIEVPAAALIADHLAREVDFFSIGTNDLIQYALAVDRTDETVADLYTGADPAVLRLIAMIVEAAEAAGIEVSVCGAMGGEPLYSLLLIGLGLRHLSMAPHQLLEVRRVIRAIRADEARRVAREALRLETAAEVADLLGRSLRDAFPEPT